MPDTSQKTPPRYVPTLTQVVANEARSAPASVQTPAPTAFVARTTPAFGSPAMPTQAAQQLRQQLLTQTRQYIDIQLQRRIRETVSQLALEHAHKMFEELQPQLEATINQVVDEAVKHALAHAATHAP
jgi:hypothetical protein